MNIFFLDKDTHVSANLHYDKHVVKMIVEYAQLMSTAHRVLDGVQMEIRSVSTQFDPEPRYYSSPRRINVLPQWDVVEDGNLCRSVYHATHVNHPSSKWVRESSGNYNYLYRLFACLCIEYTTRYGKIHSTYTQLHKYLKYTPLNLSDGEFTVPPVCANGTTYPETFEETINGYRDYYMTDKLYMKSYDDERNNILNMRY